MKNANIFIDVDLTLIDAQGQLIEGAGEALRRFREAGCHLYLWSTAGGEYARKVAAAYQLTEFFEGFAAKPDIVIDDMPGSTQASFNYNVQEESSWPSLAERIIDRHID